MIARRTVALGGAALSMALGAAALGTALSASAARPQGAGKPPASTPARPTETLDITAEEADHNDATGKGTARDVVAVDGDTTFRAKRFVWDDRAKIAEATGDLLVTDPKADVTADRAVIHYGRSKRIVVLTGNVHIQVKPKQAAAPAPVPAGPAPVQVQDGKAVVEPAGQGDEDSLASARKRPAEITCQKVEYHYARDNKYGDLTGDFKVVQKLEDKSRTLTAPRAEWYGREERVLLHAPVAFEDTKGVRGSPKGDVTVYTAEGDERIVMKQGGHISLPVEDEEEPQAPPAAPPKAAPGGQGPPAAPATPAAPAAPPKAGP